MGVEIVMGAASNCSINWLSYSCRGCNLDDFSRGVTLMTQKRSMFPFKVNESPGNQNTPRVNAAPILPWFLTLKVSSQRKTDYIGNCFGPIHCFMDFLIANLNGINSSADTFGEMNIVCSCEVE